MASQRSTSSQATCVPTPAVHFCGAHVSDNKVALFKQGSEGTHGPRCLSQRQQGSPRRRAAQKLFLGGRLVPTHVRARRHEAECDMQAVSLSSWKHRFPPEMTPCAGGHSECRLGTRPSDLCRPGGRLCVSCAGSARRDLSFFVTDPSCVTATCSVIFRIPTLWRNLARPSGKRHSVSHPFDHISFDAIDHVPSNISDSSFPARLHICQDNETVLRMNVEGRNSNLTHVSRTDLVDFDWLFERINLDCSISIRCVRTTEQLADMLTVSTGHLLCSCSTLIHHLA